MFRIKLSDRYPLRVAIHIAAGYTALVFFAFAFPVLYIVSRYNYNLFHGLADIFTIVIACTVFVVAWNSRESIDNNYLLYAGIGFLSFAFLDLFHVLGNKDMGVFPQYGNLGPTLYIASRYVLSISLVTAPLFINRKLRVAPVFAAYSLVTLLVLLSVFYWQNFPVCFVEGVGLTTFKVMSDYIICLILLGALVFLLLNRRSFDARVLRLLAASILLSIATGLAFTLYADPFGVMNAIGHFFQIISFYLIYLAVIETGLTKPQNILFRKLKESEEKYRLLVEHAPTGIFEIDFSENRFKTVNETACKMLGFTEAEILAMNPMDFLDPDSREIFLDRLRKAQEGEALAEEIEYKGKRKDGSEIWGSLHSKLQYREGRIVGAFVVAHDITERKRAEEALEKIRFILAEGQRIAHLGTFEYVADTQTTVWSEEEYRIYGLDPGGPSPTYDIMLAKSIHPGDAVLLHQTFMAAMEGESVYELEHRIVRPDGGVRWVYDCAHPYFDRNGKLIRYVGATLDITERKRAEEALRKAKDELEERVQERTEELAKSQQRLQQLASQLLLAQEKERKRVAVELHDGLLSELAAIKYLLEGKLMLLEKGTSVDADGLKRIADILGLTMKEARRIMNNLHPSVLDELGFLAAMNWLCGEYQKSYPHISVQTKIAVSESDISDGIRIVIFRVLQEALNNFAKHGKGDRVEVSLLKSEGTFSFVIRDNGQGFDVENAEKGLGLESMRERVELSGGEFQIESIIGQGTTIRAIWSRS